MHALGSVYVKSTGTDQYGIDNRQQLYYNTKRTKIIGIQTNLRSLRLPLPEV